MTASQEEKDDLQRLRAVFDIFFIAYKVYRKSWLGKYRVLDR